MKQPKAAPRHRGAAFLHGKTAQHTHGRGEDSKAPAGRVLPFSRQTAPPSQEAARESCGSGRENTVPVIGRIETPEAQGFRMRMRPVRNRTRPCKKVQRVLDIEIFKSHLQKIFLTVFLLRLYALDNFWVISPVGVLLISANYAAKNRRAQRWNCLQ